MAVASPRVFLVLGARGDGKSSLVAGLCADGQKKPEAGRDAKGVTKAFGQYLVRGLDGEEMLMIDSMGVGDMTVGASLVAHVREFFESKECQVDGLVLTSLMSSSRIGVATNVVKEIIRHGLVKDENGISPWQRSILVGTKRDQLDGDEVEAWRTEVGRVYFEDCGVEPGEHQIVTSSSRQPGGLDELRHSLRTIGQGSVTWDPHFSENGGSQRLAAGLCGLVGGDPSLEALKMEVEFACMRARRADNLRSGVARGVGGAAFHTGFSIFSEQLASETVCKEITKQVVASAAGSCKDLALRIGQGVHALTEGSEKSVVQALLQRSSDLVEVTYSGGGHTVINVSSIMSSEYLGMRCFVEGPAIAGSVVQLGAQHLFGYSPGASAGMGFLAHTGSCCAMGAVGGGAAGACVFFLWGAASWLVGYAISSSADFLASKGLRALQGESPEWREYAAKKAALDAYQAAPGDKQHESGESSQKEAASPAASTSVPPCPGGQRDHLMVSARFDGGETERFARDVARELELLGAPVYIVRADAGDQFGPATVQGLHCARALLCFLTEKPSYGERTESAYCSYAEVKYAIDQKLPLVPVRLCEQYPPRTGEPEGSANNVFAFPPDLVYVDGRGGKAAVQVAQEVLRSSAVQRLFFGA